MTHLDGTGDENLVVNTTAFPTRSPANPGFVHLNMVLRLSENGGDKLVHGSGGISQPRAE